MVVRAERCEDNSPKGEICKAGVLYEAGSVWCEGVLRSAQKLKKSSLTSAVLYFRPQIFLSSPLYCISFVSVLFY